ncbi:hypothetical protein CQA40_08595 [Helicobacter sp. MIT 01-3238]|nr:hypothetical protein CQA40_08595 [Helicobacter sp. MIT 01-3238]
MQANLNKHSKQKKRRTKSKQVAKAKPKRAKQNKMQIKQAEQKAKKPKSSTQNASKIEGFKI